MRTRILGAALVAAAALVCPQAALARITIIGTGTNVVCGTTPTKLDDTSVPDAISRYVMARIASGSGVVYIGHHTAEKPLTTANGEPLYDKERFHSGERIDPGLAYYCIATVATPMRVWEQG